MGGGVVVGLLGRWERREKGCIAFFAKYSVIAGSFMIVVYFVLLVLLYDRTRSDADIRPSELMGRDHCSNERFR